MSNLRTMIDSSLVFNNKAPASSAIKANDDVVIRRKISRTGPATSEVIVGRVLAMNDDKTAKVSVQTMGITKQLIVPTNQLQKVTESFRRQSMQLNPAFRPRA